MNQITAADALAMLSQLFEEPVENLSPEVLREEIPGWDSMGALILMAELDERFGIELTAGESREMVRVEDLLNYLRRHGALSG